MAKPALIIPFDPGFLGDGFQVPMPTLGDAARARSLDDGRVFDYAHFSLVMARERRTAIFAANNIDAAHKVQIGGGLSWHMDERIGEYQLGPDTYAGNQIDCGHLVRREDVVWGSVIEARGANASTYFYSNATPQHKNFNQGEWKTLEDWVLQNATDFSYRLCVLTGTVMTDSDPTLLDLPPELRTVFKPAQLPAAFWKVIVLRDGSAGGDDLAAVAFAMKQSEAWNDFHGRRLLQFKTHQVTLEAIESWTGIDFGALKTVDELAADRIRIRGVEDAGDWPRIGGAGDIVWAGAARRQRGLRALPIAAARSVRPLRSATNGCGCTTGEFDARAAVATLSNDVAQLTELVAAMERDRGATDAGAEIEGPGPRALRSIVPETESASEPAAGQETEDPRIQEIVDAAPAVLRDQVAAFARKVVTDGRIARKEQPPAQATQRLRVVGGDTVPAGAFMSCVCVGIPDWGCTGVVVAPQIVLTAAHCGSSINRIMVGGNSVLGPRPDGRVIAVRTVRINPEYLPYPRSEHDITVLILETPAMVPPAPLASAADLATAQKFRVVGFGYNDPVEPKGFGTKRFVDLEMPAIMARTAGEDLGSLPQQLGFHPDYEFVMGRKTLGRDSCNGDSGGPIYIPVGSGFMLAGLTSRATRTAVANCGDGGIYVRPGKFLTWLDEVATTAGVATIPR